MRMNREAIEAVILAREPYLWLDEVVSIDDDTLQARKHLDKTLPVFQGHYAGFPLFPGALQCEAAFQAAAVLIARTQPVEPGCVPVIGRVANVKFRQLVRPGDTLDIEVQRQAVLGQAIELRGKVSVGGVMTTELNFVATQAAIPSD